MKFALGLLATFVLVVKTSAFALLGPFEEWQTPELGYNAFGNEIGAPKNLGEEYRWNVPVITYGFDESFLDYFGTAGVAAVQSAFDLLNSVPAASDIVVTNFPVFIARDNVWATRDNLVDLRSAALAGILEELGLAPAERYVWTLRSRSVYTSSSLSFTNYYVIQRNFDPVTWLPSKLVNGGRQTYQIVEFANPSFADALETSVDPEFAQTTILSFYHTIWQPWPSGIFFVYLTQDELGGLRYLLSSSNLNYEALPDGVSAKDGSMNFVNHAMRPGVEKLTFQRVTNEWFANQGWSYSIPFADRYFLNGTIQTQELVKTITRPDIVFSAHDTGITADRPNLFSSSVPNWNSLASASGAAGPGTLSGPVNITFTTSLGGLYNSFPGYTTEESGSVLNAPYGPYNWGWFYSFDLPMITFPVQPYSGAPSTLYITADKSDPSLLTFGLSGYPNLEYIIEGSTDFHYWTEIIQLNLGSNGASTASYRAIQGEPQFFRVRSSL